jgi:hypothetical protein
MKYTLPIFFLLLLLTMPMAVDAQSCTTAVCKATDTSEAAFLAALPSSGNTNATVVVNIPAGSSSWSTGFNYTVPSAVTSLTIQGATTITWTGTAGTSSYAYTTADHTVIQDSYQSINPLMLFTVNNNANFRMTGLTIEGGNVSSNSNTKYGIVNFKGTTPNLRVDHNHWNNSTYSPAISGSMSRVYGGVVGVFDHNVADLAPSNTAAPTNGFQAFDPADDTIGNGDGSWANPTGWGQRTWLFLEANFFNGGAPDDCADGGRFVMRYNTINDAYVGVQSHGTKSQAGPARGCRAYEVYHNYFTINNGDAIASGAIGSKGDSQLIWGNTMDRSNAYRFYESSTDRNSGATTETNTPNGWGYCGTAVNSNGVGSSWDGNQSGGYPCLDGLGRGQTQQALNGNNFPTRLNSSTGTIAWPQQYLEPIYLFMNTITGGATYAQIQDSVTQNNRDYYYDCGQASGNTSCSGGFTGAAGTGYGTLANRPSTCTAGPGGTYFTSPKGSYGVAYFATDANGGNGELYVCSSTNTWTGIYQPYTYPHPLVTGSSATPGPPGDPANLTGVVK